MYLFLLSKSKGPLIRAVIFMSSHQLVALECTNSDQCPPWHWTLCWWTLPLSAPVTTGCLYSSNGITLKDLIVSLTSWIIVIYTLRVMNPSHLTKLQTKTHFLTLVSSEWNLLNYQRKINTHATGVEFPIHVHYLTGWGRPQLDSVRTRLDMECGPLRA